MITSLAKAMSNIADELPRIELTAHLYAGQNMKDAVIKLYAYIVKFFVRALDWYRERPLQHMLHSITRPAEVRYKDLIAEIKNCSRIIDRLARLGQQIEQRAMYRKLEAIETAFCFLCQYTTPSLFGGTDNLP